MSQVSPDLSAWTMTLWSETFCVYMWGSELKVWTRTKAGHHLSHHVMINKSCLSVCLPSRLYYYVSVYSTEASRQRSVISLYLDKNTFQSSDVLYLWRRGGLKKVMLLLLPKRCVVVQGQQLLFLTPDGGRRLEELIKICDVPPHCPSHIFTFCSFYQI